MSSASARAWDGKSRGGRFGYLFFVRAVRLLGIRFAYAVLAFIAIYFIPFAPRATAAVWRYNRRMRGLGRMRSVVELYRHYYVFGQTLIDRIAFRSGLSGRYRFEFDNYDRFLEIINSGEGVVMIGAHVGCWEAGAGFFGKYGKKINIVMFDDEHRQIKEVLEECTSAENDYKIIAVNRDPIAAMIEMKVALNSGEYVCFNGDRYLDLRSTLKASFMGCDALFPSGPFTIAAKCRSSVVFYYAVRERGMRYRFIFREAVMEGRPSPQELLEQYVSSLGELLARYPRQWFNFYDFWKQEESNI